MGSRNEEGAGGLRLAWWPGQARAASKAFASEQDKQGSRQELEGAILSFRDGSCTPGK